MQGTAFDLAYLESDTLGKENNVLYFIDIRLEA
jgi:hypothetical protein